MGGANSEEAGAEKVVVPSTDTQALAIKIGEEGQKPRDQSTVRSITRSSRTSPSAASSARLPRPA